MKLNPKRRHEILKAVFSHFVKKDLIKESLDNINVTELGILSKALNCESHSLHSAIEVAIRKVNNAQFPVKQLECSTEEDETSKVMMSAVKYKLKNLRTSLTNFRHEIHDLADELNENDRDLDLMSSELACFFYPIYLELTQETFETLKLIPNF